MRIGRVEAMRLAEWQGAVLRRDSRIMMLLNLLVALVKDGDDDIARISCRGAETCHYSFGKEQWQGARLQRDSRFA